VHHRKIFIFHNQFYIVFIGSKAVLIKLILSKIQIIAIYETPFHLINYKCHLSFLFVEIYLKRPKSSTTLLKPEKSYCMPLKNISLNIFMAYQTLNIY